jgi:hypothetical protein
MLWPLAGVQEVSLAKSEGRCVGILNRSNSSPFSVLEAMNSKNGLLLGLSTQSLKPLRGDVAKACIAKFGFCLIIPFDEYH